MLGLLDAMHGQSCAYCQGILTQSDRGDVEHFRPKNPYWWLAYDFNNYLLSCSRCNRVRKIDRFPLRPKAPALPEAPEAIYDIRASLTDDLRLLIDPVTDTDVEEWIDVAFENTVAFLKAATDVTPRSLPAERIEETINFFKLNEDKLVAERTEHVYQALEEVRRAIDGDQRSREKIKKLASRYEPYGSIIRKVIEKSHPTLLPTPEEEVRFLIEKLLRELNAYQRILTLTPKSKGTVKTKKQVCWTLAMLWKYPPGATPAQVQTWIDDTGFLGEVQPYYDQL